MARTFHDIAAGALALDPADRLRLAAELIDSVEGQEDPTWSEAWASEIERRSSEADEREARGEARGLSWDEARRQVLRPTR